MRLIAAAAAIAAFVASAAANMPPPPELAAEQEVREAVVAWFENFNAGSVEGVVGMYSDRPGVKVVENGVVTFTDKAEMAKRLAEGFKIMPGARLEIDGPLDVLVFGDAAAVATVGWKGFAPDGQGGETQIARSLSTLTLSKEGDGAESWRIVSAHSSATPAAPGAPSP